jgi:EmrB/QacA subfamily drug resistance transporter
MTKDSDTGSVSQQNPEQITVGTGLAIAGMCLSMFIIANDISAMNVALPSIEKDFDTDISTVQWVINAYALFTAMSLVAGGRLADMYGRRKVFFIGTGIFASMSFLGGIAQDVYWLIAARALMGIGGSLIWPSVLGITFDLLPKSKAGLAGGLIIGAAGLGQAVGPITGGALTELLSWRWIQYINVPISALAITIAWTEVRESAVAHSIKKIDYAGILTLSAGLLLLLFALDQANSWGWTDWRIILSFTASAVFIILFIFIERAMKEDALTPPDLFTNRRFIASCAAVAFVMPTFFVSLLFLPQLMQKLLKFSVLDAGLGLLPMMVLYASFSFIQGKLSEKFSQKAVISLGAFCVMTGVFLLSRIEADFTYLSLVPGMCVIGLGLGLFLSSNVAAAVASLDPSRSSLAGGLVLMFQIAGGALGLGITTAYFVASSRVELKSELAREGLNLSSGQLETVQGVLSGAQSAKALLSSFGHEAASTIMEAVPDAFVSGITHGFMLDALLGLAGFLVALFYVAGRLRIGK